HFGYNNVAADANLRLTAQLTLQNGAFQVQVPGFTNAPQFGLSNSTNCFTIPAGGGNIEASLQADLSGAPTGVFTYTLTMAVQRFDGAPSSGPATVSTGSIVHVNPRTSPLGSGWGLKGLQQLVVNPDGSVLLIDGDGTALLFTPPTSAGEPYGSPDGDFST